jgi:transitional endoplasmic reticulum ATPase
VTVEELARLTPRCSGADIEAICRRAALLALREWIAPKLNLGRVQVTEAREDGESQITQEQPGTAAEDTTAQDQEEEETARPSTGHFQIRAVHFAQAIDEQRERYAVQEEVEDAQKRQEAGRQRLLEIAADYNSSQKPPLRGFRLWLARLFGLA